MATWHGYKMEEFEFEGRKAVIVFPEKPENEGNWTLKTEYWDAFPETELALLEKGFHAAYLQNKSRLAPIEDCDAKARFVDYISEKYKLRGKCVPVGFSCGGAHAVNFAGYYPEKVACMFIDAPVLNFCDFPGRTGFERQWENEFLKAYPGMNRAKLLYFENHPINRVQTLIDKCIPILMLYGTEDKTVEYEKNGKLLEEAYIGHEELLTVIARNFQGHHPHGIPWNTSPVVDFIIKNTR